MTKLRIITADERLAQDRGVKGVITGPSCLVPECGVSD